MSMFSKNVIFDLKGQSMEVKIEVKEPQIKFFYKITSFLNSACPKTYDLTYICRLFQH